MFGRPWAGAGCRALAPIQSIVTAATRAAPKRRRAVRTVVQYRGSGTPVAEEKT
jgi:hypothetical protein